jgi:NAD(P)H dehydrogenase (quinone)
MRVLLIYCHPDPESFTAAVRDTAKRALEAGGHTVTIADLHAEQFNPVMSRQERRDYHDAALNLIPVAQEIERLRRCDALIFVYPTWWYGQPALLKGWLDRVWVPHATFTMPEGNKPIGAVLTNIRLLGAITTLGSPQWWWRLVGQPGRRVLLTGIRALLGRRCRTLWMALYRMDTCSPFDRAVFLAQVEARLKKL